MRGRFVATSQIDLTRYRVKDLEEPRIDRRQIRTSRDRDRRKPRTLSDR